MSCLESRSFTCSSDTCSSSCLASGPHSQEIGAPFHQSGPLVLADGWLLPGVGCSWGSWGWPGDTCLVFVAPGGLIWLRVWLAPASSDRLCGGEAPGQRRLAPASSGGSVMVRRPVAVWLAPANSDRFVL